MIWLRQRGWSNAWAVSGQESLELLVLCLDLFHLEAFSALQTHYAVCTASRLRCRYRLTRAKQAQSRLWFFAMPR